MDNKLGSSTLKTFLIITGIFVVCIFLFLLFDRMTPYNAKEIVANRLTDGVVETKKKPTPEEKVLKAVNANRTRIVKIYVPLQESTTEEEKEAGLIAKGIIFSQDGNIVTTKGSFREGVPYSIMIPGQKEIITTEPTKVGEQFVMFNVDGKMPLVAQLDTSKPSKGDMVVAIGGRQKDAMATGEIIAVEKEGNNMMITTTIPSKSVEIGAPLMNTNENIIGLYAKKSANGTAVFISVETLADDIK